MLSYKGAAAVREMSGLNRSEKGKLFLKDQTPITVSPIPNLIMEKVWKIVIFKAPSWIDQRKSYSISISFLYLEK